MSRFLRLAGLAMFCAVFGFVGSLGAVWVLGDYLRGDVGPVGPVGPRGPQGAVGPVGPAAPTYSGAYVLGDPILTGVLGCPDGTSRDFLASSVFDSSGDELVLCRID